MTCRSICFCNGTEASNEHSLLLNVGQVSTAEDYTRDTDETSPSRKSNSQNSEGSPVAARSNSRDPHLTRHLDADEALEVKELTREKDKIAEHVTHITDRLTDAEQLVARFKTELQEADVRQAEIDSKLRQFEHKLHLLPKRPGPFEWVDSTWFGAVCNVVVLLNLTFMAEHKAIDAISAQIAVYSDNIFLVWYVLELTFKFLHYRHHLFFGRITAVWWNWLDLGIVGSGVVDQWVMPLIGTAHGGSMLGALRLLRLFRLLRFLKIIKAFLVADLSWISDSKAFELFMSGVISVNAITIGMELDMKWWSGWFWIDNVFLVVYFSDLALRLKRWGKTFFVHPTDVYWNWLDFVVVSAGMLDSWLMPAIKIIQTEIAGVNSKMDMSKLTKVMSLMKLMRLLRVLRLVRVLRGVPPLYTMLIGVIEAFKSMQYVIVLAIMTLYGGSIIFTNLVGEGMIYGDEGPTQEALNVFGTVSQSFFSLFELMNGDTSVIEPIKHLVVGRLIFAAFMVISNWAILAILTAVVSDQMISASTQYETEVAKENESAEEKRQEKRLLELFEEKDLDHNGLISRDEWSNMLSDPGTLLELSEGTHLAVGDLIDLFDCLAVEGAGSDGKVMYSDLVHSLKANSSIADKRAVLHVMLKLQMMDKHLSDKIDRSITEVKEMINPMKKSV